VGTKYEGGNGTVGDYRLGRTLESGVTGEVFEATHEGLAGSCAVKILRAALTDRIEALPLFRADVEAVAALRHPNVLHVLEVGSRPDVPAFVVTERVDGRSLADRLGAKNRLPLRRAVQIVRGIASGLQAAHHAGVVHGELNPRNVFLASSEGHEHGLVKLLDFGIVRLRSIDEVASLPVETIRYLSPEQAAGRTDEIDARSDQFALAAIAYRMLSGRDAFPGDSAVSLLYQIVHGQPAREPIAEGGPPVEAVIRQALARDPGLRFDSVGAFAHALTAAAGVDARPTPPPIELPPPAPDATTAVAPAPVPAPAPAVAPAAPVPPVQVHVHLPDDGRELFTHPFFEREPQRPRRRRVRVIWLRRRSRGGRVMLLVAGVALAWLTGALATGWRPPLAWRQSPLWHQLNLPYAE
jgi:eukaryotic-like serine/threonine-protein kinase